MFRFIVCVISLNLASLVRAEEVYGRFFKDQRIATSSRPESLFEQLYDPFQFRTSNRSRTIEKEDKGTSTLKGDDVLSLIKKKGLQGVIYPEKDNGSAIIVGDVLFHVGEELVFAAEDKLLPLVSSGRVFLRHVGARTIDFEVQQTGLPGQTISYSLAAFWRR